MTKSTPKHLRGQPVPGKETRFRPGQLVECLDYAGRWLPLETLSGITYGHDFEVVWVRGRGSTSDGIPWPAEHVRPA